MAAMTVEPHRRRASRRCQYASIATPCCKIVTIYTIRNPLIRLAKDMSNIMPSVAVAADDRCRCSFVASLQNAITGKSRKNGLNPKFRSRQAKVVRRAKYERALRGELYVARKFC